MACAPLHSGWWHDRAITMTLTFNPMTHLRRLRQARQLRLGSGHELPAWALAEVRFSAAQAGWLLRTLCNWHALSPRGATPAGDAAVPVADLMESLSQRGISLRACRLADAQGLRRGDVVMLGDDAANRLFGGPAAAGGGMALVIDAGPRILRLSPALVPDPLSCRCTELRGLLVGWVLRSQLQPGPRALRAGWGEELASAL